ncbi:protease modulator HflC [Polymorphobacter fuscus]|uniref:Protein HflC n=1 Tax=Sandarakinorhabdus fusca TaxID=1439888 RepID=A0A7C9GSZ9_9SPHN|nr:protease modulator HflC [Polymorphobacter fuscus]KAB7644963.1 protease modulator HflC [Polymorphobacter fuscus]MQT18251.1 protease modulator HflC [Polymorphobacter fuscus]NJC09575.1 membrane protease subunit HflC [Polymorphobacter fuscus]
MSLFRNPIVWAIGAFTLIVVAMGTLYTVHETQQVVVLRLGKPERIVNAYDPKAPFGTSGAGLVAKVPFIENTIFVDKRVLNLDMEQQTVLTTDQLRLVVDAFARFRITDPLRMVQTVGTEQNLNDALRRILASKMRNELGKQPFAALLSPERTAMMDDIQTTVNRQAKQYGAEIIDVRIKRADLPSGAPLESAFLRMRSARQQEAATIRAQGLKQAQLVRADADAQAASTYAGSFGKDPQFYAFYRAMQAYRTTFTDQSSTVVMSPNNEFLREFEGRQTNR